MTDRVPPPEWLDQLGAWGRGSTRQGHVDIWWDPAVERWLLVEHVPRQAVPAHVRLTLLKNPHATPFRARQHRVYVETDKLPCAFWIIQGDLGGHKLEFNDIEAELSQWYTGSRTPPPPGSLPFAPFDQRVLDQLQRVEDFNEMWKVCEANHSGDQSAALQAMRKAMVQYTDDSLAEAIDEAMPALLAADLPVRDTMPDYQGMTDEFIETGVPTATRPDIRMRPYEITVTPT